MKWNVFVARDLQITDLLDHIADRLCKRANIHVHRGPMPPSTVKFDYGTAKLDIPFDQFDLAVLSNNSLCDQALIESRRRLRGESPRILTPHMMGQTKGAFEALVSGAEINVIRTQQQQLPKYCKNPAAEPLWRKQLLRLSEADSMRRKS